MKVYPSNIEFKLGIDKIKEELHASCMSPLGQNHVSKLIPKDNASQIQKLLWQVNDFIKILETGSQFPQKDYLDIQDQLNKSTLKGSFLEEEELFHVKLSASTIRDILAFLRVNADEYQHLYNLAKDVFIDELLMKELDAKIDERGLLRDNCSNELVQIRSNMAKGQIRARAAINKIMKSAKSNGYTPEEAGVTVRDGRMVIAVLAEHKRHIRGFVHDESSSGQTVFLEPAEVLDINNEIRELKYAERREIIRILTDLTAMVGNQKESLEHAQHFLGIIDFVRSKALFANKYDCICPELQQKPALEWYNARHPVLEFALKEQGKKIVPLDIVMNNEQRILLISGPNAGGKSVCLKTIGALQYMVQCGLPVAVQEHSKFGVFTSLYLDIGDEQSLENDLSTYSSHLRNMDYFLNNTNAKTLFLIDEFGTGTEPQFGGAIAEVILQELNQKKAMGAITTHYGNLKKTADRLNGVSNAAMKYDVKQLRPLYVLEIGNPGSSFALEIAGKIGLNKEMLQRAKKLAGVSHVQFDRMINELEVEKTEIKKIKSEIQKKDQRLSQAIKDYEELKAYLEDEKPKILERAKAEATRIIKESNKEVERTIKDIKESAADKKKTNEARERLQELGQKVSTKAKNEVKTEVQRMLSVGDKIKILKNDAIGEIISIKGKSLEVSVGSLKTRLKISEVEAISNTQIKKLQQERVRHISGIDVNSKMTSFSPNLDIRGVRAEEAIGKIEAFLDEALLLGFGEIKVLHGKGHGVLREIVRNTLRENHRVGSMKDEHVELGGSGITVVELK